MESPLEKSRALLVRHLTPLQRSQFERTGAFTVRNWKRRYLINQHAQIIEDSGNFQCQQGAHELPLYDRMLALKLYLQHAPGDFFRRHFRDPTPIEICQQFGLALLTIAAGVACLCGAIALCAYVYDDFFLPEQMGTAIIFSASAQQCNPGRKKLGFQVGESVIYWNCSDANVSEGDEVNVRFKRARISGNLSRVINWWEKQASVSAPSIPGEKISAPCLPIKVGSRIRQKTDMADWVPKGTRGTIIKSIGESKNCGNQYVAKFDNTPWNWCMGSQNFESIECAK